MSSDTEDTTSGSESEASDSAKANSTLEFIKKLSDVPMGRLPPNIEFQRTRVECKADAPIHTDTFQYNGAYASMGVDNNLVDSFCDNFKVEVINLTEDEMEFDMIGIDPALANAFRRILIAEVPTMAIEKVLIANNTSVIQDEVLAHRLGLIPIKVDPRLFEFTENNTPNEKNTIVSKLHVRCERGGQRISVKSKELIWLPNGSEYPLESQDTKSESSSKPKTYTSFTCSQDSLPEFSDNPICPTSGDITIARLGPGQEIDLEAHAVKGIGKTHAKWSPVAPVWYRMLPEVIISQDIEDEMAEKLVATCPVKVFDIEDIGNGKKRATVARPRACTLCRECIREGKGWENSIALQRKKDHFIFKIESTGVLPPEVLFTEAVKILEDKCDRVISDLS
ncbi:DNA-directed RNA polymerases I and III subunit rpac1-like [Pyrus ussuriensis x Pyrus communis]|uniref:DNA-directed RNA polymerases I and III subunit RPAC1 n=1 Tax=Pyrus ussuriensis x Pyrus communis TaxID=2448454 RepID=A0A5N5FUY9_9ROSA|nr:DNA-directed RNA polymerases I and III subunit rpac1-like [Pyrus ussuriensis x Pyrus communis]